MRGLGAEVVKNLVLAGIKSLTMMDHEELTKEDGDSQFFAPRDKIGTNRAEASLDRVRKLNPGVSPWINLLWIQRMPNSSMTTLI